MDNSSTTAVAKFLDICLADVLDFLGLEELLLSAMPVSRYWREQALAHPSYWRYIQLFKFHGYSPNRISESVDLFLLRLSRTLDRPIEMDITCDNLDIFVPHIIQHLSHARFLYLNTSLSSSAQTLLDAFRLTQAPRLEGMVLAFGFNYYTASSTRLDIPHLPRDLFASHAPQLKRLRLENVTLLPDAEFPSCLSQIKSLRFSINIFDYIGPSEYTRLLDISRYFPNLSALDIGGDVVLDDPVFWQASTWDRLKRASFTGKLWDGRSYLSLPVAGVRQLDLRCFFPLEIIDLPNTMSGPISLSIRSPVDYFPEDGTFPCVAITFCMTTMGSVPHRERWVRTNIMGDEQDAPYPGAMAVFQQESFLERIERQEILLGNWDSLVGAGYLTRFPSLRTVVLLVEASMERTTLMPSSSSALSCPRVTQRVLQETERLMRPRVEAADVAAFASCALKDAQLPLRLELVGVTLEGGWEDFPHVFTDSHRISRSTVELG